MILSNLKGENKMKRTWTEIKETVEKICEKFNNINRIKEANKEIKSELKNEYIGMTKTENEFETIVYYDFMDNEGDIICIGYDFWNRRLVV
jgi:hypothetical protein